MGADVTCAICPDFGRNGKQITERSWRGTDGELLSKIGKHLKVKCHAAELEKLICMPADQDAAAERAVASLTLRVPLSGGREVGNAFADAAGAPRKQFAAVGPNVTCAICPDAAGPNKIGKIFVHDGSLSTKILKHAGLKCHVAEVERLVGGRGDGAPPLRGPYYAGAAYEGARRPRGLNSDPRVGAPAPALSDAEVQAELDAALAIDVGGATVSNEFVDKEGVARRQLTLIDGSIRCYICEQRVAHNRATKQTKTSKPIADF